MEGDLRRERLTGRVVTSVLLTGEALAEDGADRLSILSTMRPNVCVSSSLLSGARLEGDRRVFDDGLGSNADLFEEEVAVGEDSTHDRG